MARTGKFTKALLPLFESMSSRPVRALRFMTSIRLHFLPSDFSGPSKFRLPASRCTWEKEAHRFKRPMYQSSIMYRPRLHCPALGRRPCQERCRSRWCGVEWARG